MKIFFYFSSSKFLNSYLVGNEKTGEAIFIDPNTITLEMINNISKHKYTLKAILFTHTDKKLQKEGLHTFLKIYNPEVVAVDSDLNIPNSVFIQNDGILEKAGFKIQYFSVPGLSPGSYMFQIENVIFSGGAIMAGKMGKTSNVYAAKNLQKHLNEKVFNQFEEIIIMPSEGPPTSIGLENLYDEDVKTKFGPSRNLIF